MAQTLKKPKGSIPFATGLIGLCVFLACVFLFKSDPFQVGFKGAGITVLLLTAASMILVEFVHGLIFGSSPGDEAFVRLTPQSLRDALDIDLLIKLFGLIVIYGGIWILYQTLPIYQGPDYQYFKSLAADSLPYLMLLGTVYLVVSHAMLKDKRDSLWRFGRYVLLLDRGKPHDDVVKYLLTWIIKAFFLPMMFMFFFNSWEYVTSRPNWMSGLSTYKLRNFYQDAYEFSLLIDVAFGLIGYMATFKLLNTHVRYPETTVLGWVICLLCYTPFWSIFTQNYIRYSDDIYWGGALNSYPLAYDIMGYFILALMFIFSLCTVCFGLRFSNLTHRGITTSGPYAFTRHPAYFTKNISYWLIDMPFLAANPLLAVKNCCMLLAVNTIYYIRARCEEKMLAQDPIYREYQEYIRTTGGLVPRFKRLFSRK